MTHEFDELDLQNLNKLKSLLEIELTCKICGHQMKNPFLLICKNKACNNCFTTMLIENKKTCKLCKQKHEQEDECVDLTILLRLLQFINVFYNEIKGTFNKLNTNPSLYLDNFFSDIILSIDIKSEKAIEYNSKKNSINSLDHINNINKKRDDYLKKIKSYSEECLMNLDRDKFENNLNNINNKVNELNKKSLYWFNQIKANINDKDSLVLVSKILDEIKKFKVEYGKCVEQLEKDLFLDRYCLFEPIEHSNKDPYIGDLKEFNRFLSFHDLEIKK